MDSYTQEVVNELKKLIKELEDGTIAVNSHEVQLASMHPASREYPSKFVELVVEHTLNFSVFTDFKS